MNERVKQQIHEKLQLVPKKPGCYQMYNSDNVIIYVGKAKNLSNRLKSYFTGSHDAKTTQMVSNIDHFEYIITSTEAEAFLLELNYIKEYRPKYNILLMDDKTYPYIQVTKDKYPKISIVRTIPNKKKTSVSLYGPYPSSKDCKTTVEILNRIIPFRKCNTLPKKPCLYYAMNQCLAPCINDISKETNDYYLEKVHSYLTKPDSWLINDLTIKMQKAAEELEFEKAKEYRDMIASISSVVEKQKISLTDGIDRDIFGYYVKDGLINIQVFHMRNGKLIERSGSVFDLYDSVDDALMLYMLQFYSDVALAPKEILIPFVDDSEILNEFIDSKIYIPKIGIKKQLVDLACENAKTNLDNLQKERLNKISKTTDALDLLAKMLGIKYPKTIEIFDNSNIQGASSVSGMVVYVDGVKAPSKYRKYKIKTVDGADDYHTMQEVLRRRYKRVISDNLTKCDLIIVDGGIPQVKAAKEVLLELGINDINVMGLAKDDKHRTRAIINESFEEIELAKNSNLFLLLEAMQDEVHRFAITFFSKVHSESMFASVLDDIEGIGEKRKKKLLSTFDDIYEVLDASDDRLKSLGLPKDVIENLKEKLQSKM